MELEFAALELGDAVEVKVVEMVELPEVLTEVTTEVTTEVLSEVEEALLDAELVVGTAQYLPFEYPLTVSAMY